MWIIEEAAEVKGAGGFEGFGRERQWRRGRKGPASVTLGVRFLPAINGEELKNIWSSCVPDDHYFLSPRIAGTFWENFFFFLIFLSF